MSIPNLQQQLYLKNALNESADGMFDHPTLDEGSRGTARLGRMVKSLTKNMQQARAMAPRLDPVSSYKALTDTEAHKKRLASLDAAIAHRGKKAELRKQIGDRTRAAAMRERGRAGLNPSLGSKDSLTRFAQTTPDSSVNLTGGGEYRENPKRVPKAVKTYRKAAAVKKNMYRE